MTHALPTAPLRPRPPLVLPPMCQTCRCQTRQRDRDIDLATLIASGPGDVPTLKLRFRCIG